MVHSELYPVLLEAVRAFFLIVIPVTAAVAIAGGLAGALQTSTAITDVAIGYAARLLAAVVVLYFFLPSFGRAVLALAEQAFR